jgi:hypothetical protein
LPIASTTSPTIQRVGIGKIQRREFLVGVLQPQHREIATRILEHDLGLEFALVGERDLDLSAPSMTWTLVTTSPDGSTITPDPSERCIWLLAAGPGMPPKKRRKIGSSNSGLRACTVLAA